MLYATLESIWTAVLLVAFVLIVAWAWSSSRKKAFEEASRIPLEEDEAPQQEDKP